MNKAHLRLITTTSQWLFALAGELAIRAVLVVLLCVILLFGLPSLVFDGVEASPVYHRAEEMTSPPQYPMGCGQEQPDDHYASLEWEQDLYYLRI